MVDTDGRSVVSRRALLGAAGGSVGLLGTGTVRARGGDRGDDERCPDATIEPNVVHYEDAGACADDHPATVELRERVAVSLADRYSTVGALIDEGYIPYADFVTANGASGVSHWIDPAYIGDGSIVDPDRPESILVDHHWWRPIGVMFVATDDGDRVDPPPAVYGAEDSAEDDEEAIPCRPWHAHVGLPGRYAWWKYRLLYAEDGGDEAEASEDDVPPFPCDTPWMMHVWAYPHPEGVYAHDPPPRGSRGGPPAEEAGFETDAVPGEDDLGVEFLPDVLARVVANW